jgi:DNA polymerase I-like protein with 3'-5' exonuclease and polymerase domains
MIVTTIDIETTFDKKRNVVSSPFFEDQLVYIGWFSFSTEDYATEISGCFFHHNEREPHENAFHIVQDTLEATDILVGHNIKFDLTWMRECNFKYEGNLFDTMVAEYLLCRGEKQSLSLAECCARRSLDSKRTDLIQEHLDKGLSYEDVPWQLVKEYCDADVQITKQLADKQIIDMKTTWRDFLYA